MNKNERMACIMLGEFLARTCYYNVDYNSRLRKSTYFLKENESDRLLNEIMYIRCAEAQSEILNEVENIEKRELIVEKFYIMLSNLLNSRDLTFINNKINYYSNFHIDEYTINLLFENARIDLRKSDLSFSEGFFKLKILFPVDMEDFINYERELIETFLQDEIKFLNLVYSKQVSMAKKFGLIIALAVFVIILIIYYLL